MGIWGERSPSPCSPRGCAQRHRHVEVREPQTPCGQLVQIGGGGTGVSIGAQVPIAQVISKDQHNVRWAGSSQASGQGQSEGPQSHHGTRHRQACNKRPLGEKANWFQKALSQNPRPKALPSPDTPDARHYPPLIPQTQALTSDTPDPGTNLS